MHQYEWDPETGGILLKPQQSKSSNEPRPVYYREMNLLGMDRRWSYPQNDDAPIMWAEAERYIYKGRVIAKTKGGSLYTAPEVIYTENEDGEPIGSTLEAVDIEGMINHPENLEIMDELETLTVRSINANVRNYQGSTDVTYVAFSGGKDSVVTLDLVQRTLSNNEFIVVFGNTGMEFPTTLALCDTIANNCAKNSIKYIEASAKTTAENSWRVFGPPSRRIRWCCTTRKTAPVINAIYQEYGFEIIRTIMITGVRGEESAARSGYEEFSEGKKLAGQYSFHPILDWSSAEIYLYLYRYKLPFNEAYKMGFNRVGCIMCPNSSEKHEYIKRQYFRDLVDRYCDIIVETSGKDLSGSNANLFLNIGGWKTRFSGRELAIKENERVSFELNKDSVVYYVKKLNPNWKIWYKTVGSLDFDGEAYILEYAGVKRKCIVNDNSFTIEIKQQGKNLIDFMSYFRAVLTKSQYCIYCRACETECPQHNIRMEGGLLKIGDKCNRCHSCLKINSISDCCIYYHSIRGSTTMNSSITGINKYLSVGVNAEWVYEYLADHSKEPGNRKTDVMFGFMQDAGIVDKKKSILPLGDKLEMAVESGDISSLAACWACAAVNLVYKPPFKYYIDHVGFDVETEQKDIFPIEEELRYSEKEQKTRKKTQGEFWNGIKVILHSNQYFSDIGIGIPNVAVKVQSNGEEKVTMNSVMRHSWTTPIPEVILYALYKFAEKCDYYQFTLSYLMDESIEREGVSPTTIFGLDRETMIRLLNGLAMNYPDYISASFVMSLETITLQRDKHAEDILQLL